jgi:hypothetical protein
MKIDALRFRTYLLITLMALLTVTSTRRRAVIRPQVGPMPAQFRATKSVVTGAEDSGGRSLSDGIASGCPGSRMALGGIAIGPIARGIFNQNAFTPINGMKSGNAGASGGVILMPRGYFGVKNTTITVSSTEGQGPEALRQFGQLYKSQGFNPIGKGDESVAFINGLNDAQVSGWTTMSAAPSDVCDGGRANHDQDRQPGNQAAAYFHGGPGNDEGFGKFSNNRTDRNVHLHRGGSHRLSLPEGRSQRKSLPVQRPGQSLNSNPL